MARPLHNTAFVLTLFLLLLRTAAGQDQSTLVPFDEQAQKVFDYGLLQYELKAWNEAARRFEEIVRDHPLNHRTTASYVMAARCRLLAGAASPALRLMEEFRERHPESRYMAEACLIAGDAGRLAGSRSTALRWYLRSWKAANAERALLAPRIAALRPGTFTPAERRMLAGEEDPGADSELETLLRAGGGNPGVDEESHGDARTGAARHATDRASAVDPGHVAADLPVRIVAALPVKEGNAQRALLVRDLRDGMLAALDIHRANGGHPVEFELIDSADRDALSTRVRDFDADARVMVLLAGAFSEDAETVARTAAERGMLVLLPTATAEGIATLGSNIFQLNTPILQRARLLADFAYLELDAQEAVVIAPAESYARAMAGAFIARCEELGIRIRYSGWYGAGEADVETVCGRAAKGGAKSGILFAPVQNRRDIAGVLEGMRAAQLDLPVVGGGNWNHPDIIVGHGSTFTLYFEADVLADTTAAAYPEAVEAYAGRSARPFSREALFGFDAMSIALKVAAHPGASRNDVRRRIRDVFEGLRAPVNFLDKRVNAAMNIIECRKGRFVRHEAFHAK